MSLTASTGLALPPTELDLAVITRTTAPKIPSTFRTPITTDDFTKLCDLIGFSDKVAKIVKEGLGTAQFFAEIDGRTGEVIILSKGVQVLSTIRVGFKALDAVTDFASFIGSCQKGEGWSATLNALAFVSDGLGNFNDMRSLVGLRFDSSVEKVLKETSSYLTVLSLTPLIITEAVKAANLAAEAREYDLASVDYFNQGNIYQAAVTKYESEKREAAAVTKVMNIMEKTMTVALVIFAIVAATFALASVIVVPVIAALSVISATFGIIKLCRNQFIKFKEPKPEDFGINPDHIDSLRHPIPQAVAEAVKDKKSPKEQATAAAVAEIHFTDVEAKRAQFEAALSKVKAA